MLLSVCAYTVLVNIYYIPVPMTYIHHIYLNIVCYILYCLLYTYAYFTIYIHIQDGGNVAVVSIDKVDRSVSLLLQGACGSCPSSTVMITYTTTILQLLYLILRSFSAVYCYAYDIYLHTLVYVYIYM